MYEAIQGRDIIDIFAPLFNEGWYIDLKTQKLTCNPAISPDAPWIYVNPRPDIHCAFNTGIFNGAGFMPRGCRKCFKVVIRPDTVAQLIRLHELMTTEFIREGLYCKCGIEINRPYVSANYGGYNYNQSLPEGKNSYKIIRRMLDKDQSKAEMWKVGTILKRGCTEMELRLGPSKQYLVPEWADALEDEIMKVVKIPMRNHQTPKFVADHTIRKWLEHAWTIGDKTCLEFSDGKPIFPNHIDTYHEEV